MLMTADAVGGVWTYAIDLARGLAAAGVEVVLAVLGPAPSADQRAQASAVPGLKVVETGASLDWTAEHRPELKVSALSLASLAAESRVDLVHLNSPALAADTRFPCPVVAVCHSCLATWWASVRGGELPADFRWRADLVQAGYEAADRLIAPTAAFSHATAQAYGLPTAPTVVHNGRAPRNSSGRGGGEAFVLTAGRLWDDGKNAVALDGIAGQLSVPVLAAGPTRGPNGAAIEFSRIRELGTLAGAELDTLFAARPIFASLALYEPFGLAVLEAAQAGCALVLSDIPSFRELWDGAALFVDPRAEADAVQVLRGLLVNECERQRLGAAARERSQSYTVERMTAGVLDVYAQVLSPVSWTPQAASAA